MNAQAHINLAFHALSAQLRKLPQGVAATYTLDNCAVIEAKVDARWVTRYTIKASGKRPVRGLDAVWAALTAEFEGRKATREAREAREAKAKAAAPAPLVVVMPMDEGKTLTARWDAARAIWSMQVDAQRGGMCHWWAGEAEMRAWVKGRGYAAAWDAAHTAATSLPEVALPEVLTVKPADARAMCQFAVWLQAGKPVLMAKPAQGEFDPLNGSWQLVALLYEVLDAQWHADMDALDAAAGTLALVGEVQAPVLAFVREDDGRVKPRTYAQCLGSAVEYFAAKEQAKPALMTYEELAAVPMSDWVYDDAQGGYVKRCDWHAPSEASEAAQSPQETQTGSDQGLGSLGASKALAAVAIEIAAPCVTWGAMASSATLCLDDAVSLINRGQYGDAYRRALDSLRYSVGVFGAQYREALALGKQSEPAQALRLAAGTPGESPALALARDNQGKV